MLNNLNMFNNFTYMFGGSNKSVYICTAFEKTND